MKLPWITFLITLALASIFTKITGDTSSIPYFICYIITGFVLMLTLVSELKLSRRWLFPFWVAMTLQMAGFAYLLVISDNGSNLSATSHVPFLSVNPDNYPGYARNYALNGITTKLNYSQWLGYVYRLVGIQSGVGIMLSILFSYTAITFFVKTVRYYDSTLIDKLPFNIGLLYLLFYPQMLSESLQIHREALIICCLSISLYHFIHWWRERKLHSMMIAILACLPAGYLHAGSIFVAVGIGIVFICYLNNRDKVVIDVKTFMALVFVIGIAVFVVTHMELGKFDNLDVQNVAETRGGRLGDGGSGYQAGFHIPIPILSAIINTPIKSFYFLASPLPTYWRSIVDILTFLLSSLFYIVPIFYTLSHRKKLNNNLLFVIIGIILIFTIPFAWGVNNSGTAVRHRTKAVIWIAFAIVLLIQELQIKRQQKLERVKR
ncbi:MAG: hypothetical protein LBS33_08260 [Streptococcaceae bacterium]|nr:hypothetical protein [Streptococcaceae bacterium]